MNRSANESRGPLGTTLTREQRGPTLPVRVPVSPPDGREYHRAQ